MARPIAYNASGPLSGSIRGGSVNYTVDGAGRDYTTFASKKWVPSADGISPIVFVTDSYTQGSTNQANAYPLFYACAGTGSAAILYTANRVPNSAGNYVNANVAINDLITNRGYFILESNNPFEGVDADSLVLDVDASKRSSYPYVGSVWIDLSGNSNTVTLQNGLQTTFSSSGWFTFDGTDDYGFNSSTSLNITDNVTINAWIRHNGTGDSVGNYISKAQNNGYRMRRNGTSGSPFWIYSFGNSVNGGAIYDNLWYMVTGVFSSTGLRAYINGNLVASNSTPYAPSSLTLDNLYLGAYTIGTELFGGDMMGAQVYSSALTEAQVKQNYFGSPIVTDGLVFAVDANNIVSYPKSGTTAYDLTGSNNGTLTNGVGYLPNNGGTFDFDGTNDYIDCGNSSVFNFTNTTISCWFRKSKDSLYKGLVDKGRDGYGAWSLNVDEIYSTATFKANISGTARAITALSAYDENAWTNVVGVFDGTNLMIYQNGVLSNSASYPGSMNTNSTSVRIGAANDGLYYNGEIANTKIYNRALSASEILQNYQAEQYRFETPTGPVTNGLVLYWDAGNLDSYPGTGTTIYDLSGNGNNGNLVNGVGYNQTNGGVLVFDGVDDLLYYSGLNLSSTNYTLMGAARYSGGTRGRMINSTNNNWLMGHWNNSTENYYAEGWVSGVQVGANDTNWRIYAALGNVSTDSYSLYVNDSLSVGPNNGGSAGPNGISVGAQGYGAEYSTGQFSFVLAYNRVLTTAEMTQNYNYFKGRFGL